MKTYNTNKKNTKITIFSLAAVVALSISLPLTIASCSGVDLMKRTLSEPNKYKAIVKEGPTSWIYQSEQLVTGFDILNNVVSPMAYYDKFNQIQGDICKDDGIDSKTAYTEFTLRDGSGVEGTSDDLVKPSWVDSKGEFKSYITGFDFLYSLMFMLNPFNSSANTNLSYFSSGNVATGNINSALKRAFVEGAYTPDTNADKFITRPREHVYADMFSNFVVSTGSDDTKKLVLYDAKTTKAVEASGDSNVFKLEANTEVPILEVTKTTVKYYTQLTMHPDVYSELKPLSKTFLWKQTAGEDEATYTGAYSETEFENSFSKNWWSGAYYVKDVTTEKIVLLANNNYHLKAIGGNITELQYTISPSANANKMRLMFESGNITNAVLSVVDSAGWNKYVGKDVKNPKFTGAHLVSKPNPKNTWMMFSYWPHGPYANYANDAHTWGELGATNWKGDEVPLIPTSKQAKINKTMALTSVRMYIATHMNRSYIAHSYSNLEKQDFNYKKDVSRQVSNSMTAPTLFEANVDGKLKNYVTSYIQAELLADITSVNNNLGLGFNSDQLSAIADNSPGSINSFSYNPFLILNAFDDSDSSKFKNTALKEQAIAAAKKIASSNANNFIPSTWDFTELHEVLAAKVKSDLSVVGINEQITIPYALDPDWNSTYNPLYKSMFNAFNSSNFNAFNDVKRNAAILNSSKTTKTGNSMIKFEGVVASTHDQYHKEWYWYGNAITGLQAGWTNGIRDLYKSVSSVLKISNGDWTAYQGGLDQIFDLDDLEDITVGDFSQINDTTAKTQFQDSAGELLKSTKDMFESMEKLSTNPERGANGWVGNAVNYAKVEYKYIYKSMVSLPLFCDEQEVVNLTYLVPYKMPNLRTTYSMGRAEQSKNIFSDTAFKIEGYMHAKASGREDDITWLPEWGDEDAMYQEWHNKPGNNKSKNYQL